MNEFLKRTLTGALFVAVILTAVWINEWTFLSILIAINIFGLFEYCRMFLAEEKKLPFLTISIIGVSTQLLIILQALTIFNTQPIFSVALIYLITPLLFIFFIRELFFPSESPFHTIALSIAGILYISLPSAIFCLIPYKENIYYPQIACGIFLLIWANDTFAYLIGRALGKHRLFPRWSPKKTWEGFIGGLIGALAVGAILSYQFTELSMINWFVLAAIFSIFGTLGDLSESMLKRSFGLKDSGNILPGHGGILDRFDALLFATPFAAAYLFLVV